MGSDAPVEEEPAAQAKAPETQAKAVQPPSPPPPPPDPELERELRELTALGQDAENKLSALTKSGADFTKMEKMMNLPAANLSAAEAKKLIDEQAAKGSDAA
jgi:hypothetical protein